MRHLLAVVAIAAAAGGSLPLDPLGAQALPSATASHGWTERAAPIRADLWFDEQSGVASFDLNRRGYVAVFAIQPMGRMELIYPTWGRSEGSHRSFRSGRHSVRIQSRMYHLAGHRGWSRSSRSTVGVSDQTYIVLIASERPLRLDPLMATGTLPWLDHPSVTWNPFVATDHLAQEIVPRYDDADAWTAAYHVVWPATAWNRYDGRTRYTRVICPGNIVIAVPLEAIRAGVWSCPRRDARPDHVTRPRDPRGPAVPRVTDALPERPRSTGDRSAIPVGRPGADAPDRARSRPPARPTPTTRSKPATRPSPAARPAPAKRPSPEARPKPATRPRPEARPQSRPRPEARPRPAPRPTGKVKPKPKPKKDDPAGR